MPHSAMQMFLALGAVLSAHVAALKFQKPECTDRMRGGFSRNIMRHHCGADLTSFSSDVTESAVACEAASTPFLHRALANKMFSQCGDACVYDFEQPEKIEFVYNEEKKCYAEKRNGGCSAQDPVAVENVKQHKSQLCEAELCHPFIPDLTENIMLRYCGEAGANGQDHSPDAKGCEETYTAKVQTALANHMFKHCGAWCLFDYDEPDKVSYAWDDKQQCWKQGGCVGHPEQQYAVERRNKACEYTTTTTTMTTTSTSTTTASTITSTSTTTTSTSTVTSTSTTTTSTVTSTSTTTTSTITSTSTTTTSTTTSTTTTSTSTVTSTSTTTTSTSTVTTTTTTETTTSTTSTSTSTTTTSTSTETITTTSTSTSTTSTSTVTSTSTTTTKTSTTTSTSTTSTSTTSTSTQTSTTTTVTETTTSTITSTSTVTSTSTSTTSTSTTTCQPPVGFLTDDLTKSHCSTLITNFVDRSTHVSSCDGATTPFVQRALANHMFAHCGAWCLYDFDFPEKISYAWDKEKQCFEPGGKCQGHKEQAVVVQRKGAMCEVETPLCYPVAAKLTPAVMYRYCDKLSTNGEDRSPEAKGCHDSYTPYVQRSLANKMFSHCGAWCLYDFDKPDTVAYSWNEAEKCWHRGSGCLGHPEQKLATERKKDFCEAELCIPVQSILSETLMLSYCNDLGKTEDRTPHAKSCDSALSGQVHKALANKMFSHCGAWCIFDFDEPDKVAFGWNPQGKCWKKSDSCGPQLERDVVVKRKSQFCKA